MAAQPPGDRTARVGPRSPVKDDSSRYMRRSAALPRLGEVAEHEVIRTMEHLRRARDR